VTNGEPITFVFSYNINDLLTLYPSLRFRISATRDRLNLNIIKYKYLVNYCSNGLMAEANVYGEPKKSEIMPDFYYCQFRLFSKGLLLLKSGHRMLGSVIMRSLFGRGSARSKVIGQ
jgi:hypothetical protein